MLGGSRARGQHTPESDVDLGLYYRPPLDTAALGRLARAFSGPDATVTEPGDWGPWVDGGAWLTISGTKVDWIYRDLDRVQQSWRDAQHGRYRFHAQVGHPLGVPDFTYAGEVGLGVILSDPSGELGSVQEAARVYPEPLRARVISGLQEATFLLEVARKAIPRADTSYLAGCLFRVVELCAHAVHAHHRRWLVNEKGAVTAAGDLPYAPTDFAARAHGLLAGLGIGAEQLAAGLDRAGDLVDDTISCCRDRPSGR